MAILNVENLSYKLPNQHLLFEDINFTLNSSGGLLIFGPTGSGKTTLTRLLLGLRTEFEGQIEYEDHLKLPAKRSKISSYRRKIGFMLQEPVVFEEHNLYDNIRLYLKLSKVRTEKKDIMDRLYDLGLASMTHKPIESLSWGQKRCVEMLRLILKSPRLVICDQPFAAVDQDKMVWMKKRLQALVDAGSAVLVTYSLPEVREYFDWPEIRLGE